ncbi:unnamed protein product [Albugo candida]|uniref:Uncharacterized protein n=1 Tax=Albugo candida TaxID=65357 RepID=A0A024GF45_9STRA|nr:unnamed protein product [Albugo candida]|eukprot:CCI45322.1 unnamed protein product [Albugo candida]
MTQITAISDIATAIIYDAVTELVESIVQDVSVTNDFKDASLITQSDEKHFGFESDQKVVLLTSLYSYDKFVDVTVEEVMSTIVSSILRNSENWTSALVTSEHGTEGEYLKDSRQCDVSFVNKVRSETKRYDAAQKASLNDTWQEGTTTNQRLIKGQVDSDDMCDPIEDTQCPAETMEVNLPKVTLYEKSSSLLVDISLSSTDSDDSDSYDDANASDNASASPISISPRSCYSDDSFPYSDFIDDKVQYQASSYLPGIPEISSKALHIAVSTKLGKYTTFDSRYTPSDSDTNDSVLTSSDGSFCVSCGSRSNIEEFEVEALSEMVPGIIPHEVGDEMKLVEPMEYTEHRPTIKSSSDSVSADSIFPDLGNLHITRYLRSKSYAPTSAPVSNFQRKEETNTSITETITGEQQSKLTPGCCVSTRYGLGTVVACGQEQGTSVIRLQCSTLPMLMYCRDTSNIHVIPAIRNDLVITPVGEGHVIDYMSRQRTYLVQIGNDANVSGKKRLERIFFETEIRRQESGRRNIMPSRFVPTTFRQKASDCKSIEARNRSQTCVQKPKATVDDRSHSGDKAYDESIQSNFLSGAFRRAVAASSELSNSTINYVSKWNLVGQYVQTKYGQGTIKSYDQMEKIVQLELASDGSVISMHVDDIQNQLKALIGMEVQTTKFGAGKVIAVRAADAIYTVLLHGKPAGKQSDTVYVHESDLCKAKRSSIGNLKYPKLKFWK